ACVDRALLCIVIADAAQRNGLKRRTAGEDIVAEGSKKIAAVQRDAPERGAACKCIASDGDKSRGKIKLRERRAARKGALADRGTGRAVRKRYGRKRGAARKGVLADHVNRTMEGDALKLRHAAEGSGRNGRSIVIDVLDRRTVEEIG